MQGETETEKERKKERKEKKKERKIENGKRKIVSFPADFAALREIVLLTIAIIAFSFFFLSFFPFVFVAARRGKNFRKSASQPFAKKKGINVIRNDVVAF